ncbi:DUF1707 domain-containing protein [Catenulispora subtropica]|uniref:DUF1707 domain-containing protein n=1 Tax=Catenulispora subtropica TaxID=450798 RepID=A0ABP5CDV4_9ACTN
MPGELEPTSRAELRASHEDRDIVVDQLRVAAGDGRIDAEELDQRIEAALSARTYGELDTLIKDLPASAQGASAARRTEAQESQSITIAHGNSHKRGAWLVPRKLLVTVRHGNVVLDFTEAVFAGPREVEVVLDVRHGNVRMFVPDGSLADTSQVAARHANIAQRDLGAPGPESVRLLLTGQVHHANVRVRTLTGFMRRRRARRIAAGTQRALP